jgi:2-polyprenyl-3-methyl-5-hydroxy-6-metoxy-1,4-benzoquinol methylase
MSLQVEQRQLDNCPICAASIGPWRTKVVRNERYQIEKCTSCGFAFVNPRPSISFLMQYYSSSGHGLNPDISRDSRITIDSLLMKEAASPNSTIDARRMIGTIDKLASERTRRKLLDVGCGFGFFSKEALLRGYDVTALEMAEIESSVAREMLGISPIQTSFEDFSSTVGEFNVVLMSQILEHAHDVNLWIAKTRDMLANDGILAIALPNFGSIFRLILQETEPYICPPAHLNFFNPISLSRLLKNHGFKVEAIQWVSRIPKQTFAKRIPSIANPVVPLITGTSGVVLAILDFFRLGMMINVYARKIGAS